MKPEDNPLARAQEEARKDTLDSWFGGDGYLFEMIGKNQFRKDVFDRFEKSMDTVGRYLARLNLDTTCKNCGKKVAIHDPYSDNCQDFQGNSLSETED